MKQTSDLLNELFASWDFSPDGIVVRQDAPEWIRQCIRYVCANINESENQDILLLLHRYSAFALKHIAKADKVDSSAYLDNAALLVLESMPNQIPFLVAWLSYNQGSRATFADSFIYHTDDTTLAEVLSNAYSDWGSQALIHAKDFILSQRDTNATA